MILQKDIEINASPILDSIFHPRKKISKYEPFTKQMRTLLMEKFQTSPFMTKEEIKALAEELNQKEEKIRFFFKNQRIKDFRSNKRFVQNLKSYKTFNEADKKILEESFRINHRLNERTLKKLTTVLSISDQTKIKNWFAYRNRKMRRIVRENQKKPEAKLTQMEHMESVKVKIETPQPAVTVNSPRLQFPMTLLDQQARQNYQNIYSLLNQYMMLYCMSVAQKPKHF